MEFNIELEDNSSIRRFFKRHNDEKSEIMQNFKVTLPIILHEKPYKIKTVSHQKYRGKTIFEYKVTLKKSVSYRAAFIRNEEKILLFFISSTTIKKDFSEELKNTSFK